MLTILTVALLLVLTLGFVAMVRMETRAAGNRQETLSAEKNAWLAVDLAIARLQEQTGPDQRVTAPADLAIPPGVTVAADTYNINTGLISSPGTSGAAAKAMVDSYWSAARNRRWVGAYRNSNTSSYDREQPRLFNATPGLQSWLVSGNEISPNAFDPNVRVTGLTAASSPRDEIRDANNRIHRLLVKASAGVELAADLDRAVTAPQVSLAQNGVPLGNLAWWVGDEGVKARANLADPYAGESTLPNHGANLARRQSAQRPILEVMPDLRPYYPANSASLARPVTPSQMGFLHADPAYRANLRDRYHELTLLSRGVLANARHGGLRGDLTHILSRRTAGDFRTALRAAFDGPDVAPSASGNIAISTASTPYAELPTLAGYPGPPTAALTIRPVQADLLDYSATWEQLWTYYNMGNSVSDSPPGVFQGGVAQARFPTPTEQGLTPILMQGKVFYRMRIGGGTVHVDVNPLVVLANPYPVPLAGEFLVRFNVSGNPSVRWGPIASAMPTDEEITAGAMAHTLVTLPNAGLGPIQLMVRATGIPAGEAQIFTVDPEEDLVIADLTTIRNVGMIPSYDPTVFLTYDTNRSVPSGTNAYVGLFSSGSFTATGRMGGNGNEHRFANIITRHSSNSDDPTLGSGFRVFPFPALEGEGRGGGGHFLALHDGYTISPYQSPFLQLNYRSLLVDWTGDSGLHAHPLQWAIYYSLPGARDQPYDDLPLPYYDANLLLPPGGPGIPNTTRWGLVNTGAFPSLNIPPPGINASGDTGLVNLLYDLPQPGSPPTSLGQLQHFNLAGHTTAMSTKLRPNSWQSNYVIGNSYATPRVPRDLVLFNSNYHHGHYDGTYLWNEILWDRFTFSSFPQEGDFDFDNPADRMVNGHLRPFRGRGQVARNDPGPYRGVHEPAKNLLLDGAFNINSTSVDAWMAVLAGLRGVPTGSENQATNLNAFFPRILRPQGGATDAALGNSENAWTGFRNLSEDELRRIAEELVLQIRLRGPFLSLSDFVNRKLTRGRISQRPGSPLPEEPHLLGFRGAIQAAIDKVVNQWNDVSGDATGPGRSFRDKTRAWASAADQGPYYGDIEFRMPNRISGFPGYVLQGDVLSAIGPKLSARSDTFTIRTYGDTARGNDTGARAWCEAVVQRLPDYVEDANPPEALPSALTSVNQRFGRRYEIIGFRWLNEEDI